MIKVLKVIDTSYQPLEEISKFPTVNRDLALLVDDGVTFNEMKNIAFQAEKKLLKNVNLFDVYEGKELPKGKKSYALSFELQDQNKTLTDKQIDKSIQKIQAQLEKQTGAQLR